MNVDLLRDWIKVAADYIRGRGVDTAQMSDDAIGLAFCNVVLRTVDPVPRSFHQSTALAVPPAHQAGYEELRRKVVTGEPLAPHMSRSTSAPEYEDLLFADWGIHHYHLGTVVEHDGFVARTGPVLFAMHRPEAFYAIQVLQHGRGHRYVWATRELLHIVHREWPDLIAYARMDGLVDVAPEPTDAEHYEFRSAGLVLAVKVAEGVLYRPPGGGITTAKTSVAVADEYVRRRRLLRQIESRLRANHTAIQKLAPGGALPEVRLESCAGFDKYVVREVGSGTILLDVK